MGVMNPKVQKYAYFACLGVWMLGVVAFLGGLGVFGAQGSGEVIETAEAVGGQTAAMPMSQPAFMASDAGFIVMNAQNAALVGGIIVMIGALAVGRYLAASDGTSESVPSELMVQ